MNQTKKSD